MGRKFEWKGISKEICKKARIITTIIYNCRVYYDINEENKGEESKCSDFESFDVDNFYNLYHSKVTLKDRK
jgi:hypothetical protein